MLRYFAVVAVLVGSMARAEDLAEVDKPAPMFTLPVYNAKESGGNTAVGLGKFVGDEAADKKTKMVMVSFMASFCAPCKKEMPVLQQLHEKYQEQGLRILVISIDTEAEGQKKVEELIATNKVTFPVLKDRFNIVARRWLGSKSPLPSLFLVRPDSTVASVHRGYSQDGAELLTQEVESALGLKKK